MSANPQSCFCSTVSSQLFRLTRSRAETHWLAMAQLNISAQLTMPTITSAKKNAGVITAIVGIMSKGLHYYIASNRAMSGHSLH
ncbi:MAG TPA: hypothetical protein VMR88_17195 [Candidatus Polarisedimenticolaceae bacterium]|nr:hypothetical protein [Candidatus Polarisedimenticolaceae bacterium]